MHLWYLLRSGHWVCFGYFYHLSKSARCRYESPILKLSQPNTYSALAAYHPLTYSTHTKPSRFFIFTRIQTISYHLRSYHIAQLFEHLKSLLCRWSQFHRYVYHLIRLQWSKIFVGYFLDIGFNVVFPFHFDRRYILICECICCIDASRWRPFSLNITEMI